MSLSLLRAVSWTRAPLSRTCCSKVSVRTRLHSSRTLSVLGLSVYIESIWLCEVGVPVARKLGFRCLTAQAMSQRSVVEGSGLKTGRTGMTSITCEFVTCESSVLDPSSFVPYVLFEGFCPDPSSFVPGLPLSRVFVCPSHVST